MRYKVGEMVTVVDPKDTRDLHPKFLNAMDVYIGKTFRVEGVASDNVYILEDAPFIWNGVWLKHVGEEIDEEIDKVIFNPPATIILWADGTKTVVKCSEDDDFDEEVGFVTAYAKKKYGDGFNSFVKRRVKNAERQKQTQVVSAFGCLFSRIKKG